MASVIFRFFLRGKHLEFVKKSLKLFDTTNYLLYGYLTIHIKFVTVGNYWSALSPLKRKIHKQIMQIFSIFST